MVKVLWELEEKLLEVRRRLQTADLDMRSQMEARLAKAFDGWKSVAESYMASLGDRVDAGVDEGMGRQMASIHAAVAGLGGRLGDAEKAQGAQFADLKELAAVIASLKGTVDNMEEAALVSGSRSMSRATMSRPML
mgnify:CR=1 FL=1